MKVLTTILIGLGSFAIGIWLHNAIADLTQTRGTKLLVGRVVIWGSLTAGFTLWLARQPLIEAMTRWAEQVERRRGLPLTRVEKAGSLELMLSGCFLIACAALTVLAFIAPDIFTHMFREDGPFELGSAVLYFVSALACIALAARKREHSKLQIWLGLLALLFIFVGGEEISWGQRIFGFDTPERLAAINVQNEFTLHNVYSNSLFVYPGLAVTAMLLFVAPLLRGLNPRARRIFDALEFPVAPLACAILYAIAVFAYAVVGLRLGTPTPLPINWSDHLPHFDDEMLEFLISALFAVFAVSNWRLLVPQSRAVSSLDGRQGRASA